MKYFTIEEFRTEYPEFATFDVENWKIKAVCEMIFSQIGLIYRRDWTEQDCPVPIKEASMEQLRFMLEHDIPFVDIDKHLRAGSMNADLKTDYSTLALRILANSGYLYRGNPINQNLHLNIPFGS